MICYEEPNVILYQGHALNVLRGLEAESVDCVPTSPPYWGLRSYKTEPIIWGDNHCEHEWGNDITKGINLQAGNPEFQRQWREGATDKQAKQGNFCLKCGAWKGELGLEPTIELYISHLLQVFDEVKRVLKKTGTLWVNIGDSYSGSGCGTNDYRTLASRSINKSDVMFTKTPPQQRLKDIPAKSLCLIPERFALGMVERGWILRNVIIWYKSNPMPESVKDRFTGTYEYVYFFTKSNTIQYWTNAVTGKITYKQPLGTKGKFGEDWVFQKVKGYDDDIGDDGRLRKRVSLWQGHTYWFEQQFEQLQPSSLERIEYPWHLNKEDPIYKQVGEFDNRMGERFANPLGRNKRDVWEITTQPYPEAHFATFPEKLCETPILAGCPSQICKKCGKAREKVIDSESVATRPARRSKDTEHQFAASRERYMPIYKGEYYTDCGCNAGYESGIVLDPFCGSGTTLAVAKRLGRKAIGIDINPDYCKLAVKRIQGISMPMELA